MSTLLLRDLQHYDGAVASSITIRLDEDAERALAADETDRAEAAQVLRDMETLRA